MRQISKENTILVAILTESGAPFDEKGVDYVRDMIIEMYPEMKDFSIIALMGKTIYRPRQLYPFLEQNDRMFIAVSYECGNKISLYEREDNPDILKGVRMCATTSPETTSWQLFSEE